MTIYVDDAQAREILATHVCGVCGGRLTDPWDPKEKAHRIECGQDKSHQGIQRVASLTESLRRGEPMDPTIEAGVKLRTRRELQAQAHDLGVGTILLPHAKDGGTDKPLTPEQIHGLIAYADRLGLDAFLGHVCLYFGRPFVHIDGWYYHARRSGWHGGARSAPLNKEERKAHNLTEAVEGWKTEIYDHQGNFMGEGFGYASRDNKTQLYNGVSEKWATPQRRAEKRSEEKAFRKCFPLHGIPEEEEITAGTFESSPGNPSPEGSPDLVDRLFD